MVLLKLTANGAQPLSEEELIAATGAGLIVTLMVVSSLQLPLSAVSVTANVPAPA